MLTDFQKQIVRVLSRFRNEGSYFAGGSALNLSYPRRSSDFDIFHDDIKACTKSFVVDVSALRQNGYEIKVLRSPEKNGIGSVQAAKDGQMTEIEWVADSSFRFFPIEEHPDLGFVLNQHDLATNKVLALAGRREVRDYYDICTLIKDQQPVDAYIWAACGKDPGYTPILLLDQMAFNSSYQKEEFDSLIDPGVGLRLSITECKRLFLEMANSARDAFSRAPVEDIGCLYLNEHGAPFFPSSEEFGRGEFYRHFGKPFGSIPVFPENEEDECPSP